MFTRADIEKMNNTDLVVNLMALDILCINNSRSSKMYHEFSDLRAQCAGEAASRGIHTHISKSPECIWYNAINDIAAEW